MKNFYMEIGPHFCIFCRSECTNKGGTAAGSCASGFGVCCTCKKDCLVSILTLLFIYVRFAPNFRQFNSHSWMWFDHFWEHHLLPLINIHCFWRSVWSHCLRMQPWCLPGNAFLSKLSTKKAVGQGWQSGKQDSTISSIPICPWFNSKHLLIFKYNIVENNQQCC